MPADYGPVPVGRFKAESSRIFDALEAGRRVLVSKQGQVVATISPASPADVMLLIRFAIQGATEGTLSAREVNQGSPSSYVTRAAAGERLLVTRDNKALGVLQPYDAEGELERLRAREAALTEFEREHPNATPEEHIAFEDSLDAAPDAHTTDLFTVLNTEGASDLTIPLAPGSSSRSYKRVDAGDAIRRLRLKLRLFDRTPEVTSGTHAAYRPSDAQVELFHPLVKIGATDQLIARQVSKFAITPRYRRRYVKEDPFNVKTDLFAQVVEVGSKFEASASGKFASIEKGDTILYRNGSAVEVEFGGEELLILSESAVVDVVTE